MITGKIYYAAPNQFVHCCAHLPLHQLKASSMEAAYQINIDPNTAQFSQAFRDFYYHHFVNTQELGRREANTAFFQTMRTEEMEMARRLVRDNLHVRHAHLFRAAGALKDEQALPLLYEALKQNTDLSWLLSIGQAIWQINGDLLYLDLLRKLQTHPSGTMKAAHFHQVTDFKDAESIDMLFLYLQDGDRFVRLLALNMLNYLALGKQALKTRFDRKHFLHRRKDEIFKKGLLDSLQQDV